MTGWNLPPGCNVSDLPGNEPEGPCEICLMDLDHCACPQCTTCGAVGDPICYEIHGLERSDAQLISFEIQQRLYKAEAEAEYRYVEECYNEQIRQRNEHDESIGPQKD